MIIFPAIDLYNKACVRLEKGDFSTRKTYEQDPLVQARKFVRDGAKYLHVIDLNAAENMSSINEDVIKTLVKNLDIPIQVGGGIRSTKKIETLIDLGVSRVILGTFALDNLDILKNLTEKYKDKIIVSIDAMNGFVTSHGWQNKSDVKSLDLAQKLEKIGIKTIVYTDIAKDGMLIGPNFNDYALLKNNTNLNIIASGGIATLDDIISLKALDLYGAITGKALYENRFTLKEALSCL
ncbi:MAG: 1-(5-phosphoribosyl)-5-[(5-phosphoribosylamino)methylideneamino]imidazole-4-carboxamide isomerase [Candidatus Izemoplasmataceae bacterium]